MKHNFRQIIVNFFRPKTPTGIALYAMICLIVSAILLFTCDTVSADDRIQFNFENTTKVTKVMRLKLMDQPCYISRYGLPICYRTRMVSEMRPDDYTVKTKHQIEKNIGNRFCIEWDNLSSNPEEFESKFCFIIKEDTTEANATPEKLEVVESE